MAAQSKFVTDFKNVEFRGDKPIWWIAGVLSIFGIIVVYSASGANADKINPEMSVIKHCIHLTIAWLIMYSCSLINYTNFVRFSQLFTLFCWLLLIYVKFRGEEINGATRWIIIAGQSFQPSDLAKIALITQLAGMMAARNKVNYIEQPFKLVAMVVWCIITCGLIAMSNTSNGLLLLATCIIFLFVGGLNAIYLVGLTVVGILVIFLAVLFGGERYETAVKRINSYTNSLTDDTKVERQLKQSYKAIAYGGFMGVGPGKSHQRNFLAFGYAEFIFAIIAEEYGLIGSLIIIGLYVWLINRAFKILNNSNRALGGFLAIGIAFTIGIQAFINIAVTLGILPTTGLTLPMVSMGGTSLMMNGLAFGILISASRGDIDENEIA